MVERQIIKRKAANEINIIAKRLNLTLPDTLNQFIEMKREGTAFVNGPEYVRHCLREKRQRMMAEHTNQPYQFHMAAVESPEQTIQEKQDITIDEMEDRLFRDL